MELSKLNLKNIFGTTTTFRLGPKVNPREAKIGVVGVGYVGQALVDTLVSSGYQTYGFDVDRNKLLVINHKLFTGAVSIKVLEPCDVIVVCVPTPLGKNRKPDLSCLIDAVSGLAGIQDRERLIIIESTVAPGTLRNIVLPVFERAGRKCGRDFYLAMSPERVDPGNTIFAVKNIPRVVGGIDEASTHLATEFYSNFIDRVVPLSSVEAAELTKTLENTFRLVNISLINEIKSYADRVGIDIWEVIDAAATKPYAFMPHYPGPGVGGHCIPVDPVYLFEEAKRRGVSLDIVRSAIKVNEAQPKKIVQEAKRALNGRPNGKKAKLFLIGIAYKPGSRDTRESPALKIWEEAEKQGLSVSYFDPNVPVLNGYNSKLLSYDTLLKQDVIVIVTDHKNVPYEMLATINKPIIDCRNIMRKFTKNNLLKNDRMGI